MSLWKGHPAVKTSKLSINKFIIMPGLLGKKIGMTSVFSADGKNIPCTVIEAGPCVVTQIKTVETDGYNAVQVGFMPKNEKHTNKAEAGHAKKAGTAPKHYIREFRADEMQGFEVGAEIKADLFNHTLTPFFFRFAYHKIPAQLPVEE